MFADIINYTNFLHILGVFLEGELFSAILLKIVVLLFLMIFT